MNHAAELAKRADQLKHELETVRMESLKTLAKAKAVAEDALRRVEDIVSTVDVDRQTGTNQRGIITDRHIEAARVG